MNKTSLLLISGLLLLIGIAGGNIVQNLKRGERNNNPGNIRKGANWQGLASEQPDPGFASFISPFYGLRAMAIVLYNYFTKYGLDTIEKIITRYAPSNENDTRAYINSVSRLSGFGPSEKLAMNSDTLFRIMKAMIHVEQGRVIYPDSDIMQGVKTVV